MHDWLKIIVPVLLTGALLGIFNLYTRINSMGRDMMHTELIDYRLNVINSRIAKIEEKIDNYEHRNK